MRLYSYKVYKKYRPFKAKFSIMFNSNWISHHKDIITASSDYKLKVWNPWWWKALPFTKSRFIIIG